MDANITVTILEMMKLKPEEIMAGFLGHVLKRFPDATEEQLQWFALGALDESPKMSDEDVAKVRSDVTKALEIIRAKKGEQSNAH